MSQKLYISLCFALYLSTNLTSLGTIIGSGLMQMDPISKTATVVVLQAIASLLVIAINRLYILKKTSSRTRLLLAASFVLIGNLILSRINPFYADWYIVLVLRTIAGYWAAAVLLADLSLLFAKQVLEVNRQTQMLSILSVAVSLGLAPVLVSGGNFAPLFTLDTLLIAISLALITRSYPKLLNENAPTATPSTVSSTSGTSSKMTHPEYFVIIGATALMWSIVGAFHVVEVPLLKSRFAVSALEISGLFLMTLSANVLTMRLLSKAYQERHLTPLFFGSAIALIGMSVFYLHCYSLIFTIFLLGFFGAANAVFNLTQSLWVQTFSSATERLEILMHIRIATNLGILVATGLIVLGVKSENEFSPLTVMSFACFMGVIFLALRLRQTKTTKLLLGAWRSGNTWLVAISLVLASGLKVAVAQAKMLRVPVTALPIDLDPVKVLHLSAALVVGQVYDTLYEYDQNDSLRPSLAKRHTINPDGTIFKIYLNQDTRFSDGSALTASDAVTSLQRAIKILGISSGWALGDIVGFEEFVRSTDVKAKLPGLSVASDGAVVISLHRPFPQLLQVLAAPYFAIVKEVNGELYGTGAYVLKKLEPSKILLTKREHIAPSGPSEIEFVQIESRDRGIQGVLSGKFDIALVDDQDKQQIESNKQSANVRLEKYRLLQTMLIQLNGSHSTFSQTKYRCEFIRRFSRVARSMSVTWKSVSAGLPFFWDLFAESSQIQLQKKESDFPGTIEVSYTESAAGISTSTIDRLTAKLSASGLKVKFRKLSAPDLFSKMKRGTFEAALWGYIPDYPDTGALLGPLIGTNQQYNFSHYSDSTIDALLDLARQIGHNPSRGLIFKKAFARLHEECPIGFLGTENGAYIINNNLSLAPFTSLGFHMVKLKEMVFK